MSLPILASRKWRKILKSGGATYLGQDSLNHHVWEFIPKGAGKPVTAAIAAHSDGADVLRVYIDQLRKAWKLTKDDGVSEQDFLSGRWTKE